MISTGFFSFYSLLFVMLHWKMDCTYLCTSKHEELACLKAQKKTSGYAPEVEEKGVLVKG